MATFSLLPLAVIHQNSTYRNHIIRITNNRVELTPFEGECEATHFISAVIVIANNNIVSYLEKLPAITENYNNLHEITKFLYSNNLYITNEEPTLISVSPLGYQILKY